MEAGWICYNAAYGKDHSNVRLSVKLDGSDPLGFMKPVKNEEIVQRVNKILVGWDNYFQCGYPTRMFNKVNWYVRNRLYLHFNRKSQRGYVLKYAPNFYQELQAMGLHMLRRRRK